jgi:N-glycosylase/DNA lyase
MVFTRLKDYPVPSGRSVGFRGIDFVRQSTNDAARAFWQTVARDADIGRAELDKI